jgi:dipeptidase
MLRKNRVLAVLLAVTVGFFFNGLGWACTSYIAGKNATVDGSVISGHNEDLTGNTAQRVEVFPRKTFQDDEFQYLINGAALPWVPEIYKVIQFNSGFDAKDYNQDNPNFLNEWGVTSWDNAQTPRTELRAIEDKNVQTVDSKELKRIPLERARTAREAVQILGNLVDTYGFIQNGMTYGIADPEEGWIVEVTKGKHWVAQRVPDDMVVMRANCYRIQEVNLADTANFLGSANLVTFAQGQGWYNPAMDGNFNFSKAYGSPSSMNDASNTMREWGALNYLKPSLNLAWNPSGPFPFVSNDRGIGDGVVPDKKVSISNLRGLLRQHYEGTPQDATNAYAMGSPHWTNNRVICVNTTNSSSIVQLRNWLPPEIGHVLWRTEKSPCTGVYVPWYLGITTTPIEFRTGTEIPNGESAWWTYTSLVVFLDAHYGKFIPKVRPMFNALEDALLAMQPAIEWEAFDLYMNDLMDGTTYLNEFLTQYSGDTALNALSVARGLVNQLLHDSARGSWKNSEFCPVTQ